MFLLLGDSYEDVRCHPGGSTEGQSSARHVHGGITYTLIGLLVSWQDG